MGESLVPLWTSQDWYTASWVALIGMLLFVMFSTPANRGRFIHWLDSRLATGGTKQQEAAAVAAILGDNSAAETLTISREKFRAWPVSALRPEHFESNEPDPAIFELTKPAELGTIHGFVSHSWSDEGPVKYDKLKEWAGGLDVGKDAETLLWVDKACIDQLNIDESLACLPVFVSGCQRLLLLVGPTYTSRLWCVMEVFIFLRMGGEREAMEVMLLDESADAALASRLAKFDAAKAKCFHDSDKQRLWAVIEASYGTFGPFNKLVRGLIAEKLGLSGAGKGKGRGDQVLPNA